LNLTRVAALSLLLAALPATPAPRSPSVRAEFQRLNPCPATGQPRGACPGWEVDHVVPICLGGPSVDIVSNLQWLPVGAHRNKTRSDIRLCRQAGPLMPIRAACSRDSLSQREPALAEGAVQRVVVDAKTTGELLECHALPVVLDHNGP
jgi:hypothetical protein